MWKIRLQEMQSDDVTGHHHRRHHHHHHHSGQVRELLRRRVSVRRMSVGDLRPASSRRRATPATLFDSLPRLFARLVSTFSRSLAFLTTSDQLTKTTTTSSSRERHHCSLDNEVD